MSIVLAILLALALAPFFRRPSRRSILLAGLLATPLFIKLSGSTIVLGDAITRQSAATTFPTGLLAVGLFWALLLWDIIRGKMRWRVSPVAILVVIFVVVNFLAFLLGLIEYQGPESLLFFLQAVVPTLAFFLALQLIRDARTAVRAMLTYVSVLATFVAALLIYTLKTKGLEQTIGTGMAPYLWIFPMYSLFDYVPLVVAIGYGLGLALIWGSFSGKKYKLLLAAGLLTMFVSFFLFHSRGAVLTALVIMLAQAVLFRGRLPPLLIGFWLLTIVVAAGLVWGQAFTVRSWMTIVEAESGEQSFQTRLMTFSQAVEDVIRHPLVGLKYVPQTEDMFGPRITYPHNQYLSYAVRAGLLSLAVFIWTVLLLLSRLYAFYRHPATPALGALGVGLLSVFLGVLLVSNFLQDNFTQPFAALSLWFFMGVGEAAFMVNRRMRAMPASVVQAGEK